ncbi:MAG: Ig-like domain-containing protein [Vicinamibacterales bacterium]
MARVRTLSLAALVALAAFAGQACDKVPFVAPSGTAITLLTSSAVVSLNGSAELTAVLVEGGLGSDGATASGAGTPVHNGTKVYFSTTLGRIEPAEVETSGGRAIARLFADGRSGVATITAYSGAATQTLEVTIGGAAATRLLVTAEPQQLPAAGGSTTIRARAEDENGNALPGVFVSFSTSAGSLSSSGVTTGDDGVASTTLSTTAAATVTASAGGGATTISGTVDVTITNRTVLTITPPTTATVSVPATIVLTLGDTASSGTATLNDVKVTFSDGGEVQLGTISQGVATTFSYLFGESGVQTITATGVDPQGNQITTRTQVAVGPLTANGTASPTTVVFGNAAVFTVTVTPATALIDHYVWDFGEGAGPETTASTQRTHVFQSRGTKIVTVKVVPTKGPTLTVLIQVEVQ